MKHKFKTLFFVMTAAMSVFSAHAVSSYTHANGSQIVDINKADANGLSHNMWKQFDVTDKGMVLNNSPRDLVRAMGNIAGNDNLDVAAKVILNEVISTKASSLKGFIEVAGERADVIVANPNGITCSGCSFVNTGRVTLTTGAPQFQDGVLTGYNVTKGKIKIEKGGLENQNSYTDLLANAITINDKVVTGSLDAIAGVYSYNRANSAATSDEKKRSGVGIDVGALGGVTAGVISLQTTNSGIGVNNKGSLAANAIQISASGNLTTSGTMRGGVVQVSTNGSLTNSGTIEASNQVVGVALNKITNSGTLSGTAGAQLVSFIGNIENTGAVKTEGTFVARTGFITNENNELAVAANTSFINSGSLTATNASLLASKEINLKKGTFSSVGTVIMQAAKVNNAIALTGNNIAVSAYQFENKGTIKAQNQLSINTEKSLSNKGKLEGQVVSLSSAGKVQNKACTLFIFCSKGTISSEVLQVIAPNVSIVADLGGTVTAQEVIINPKQPEQI
ncbi:filamentous hemagglutinin N-terminal domain-containing protein [Paramixta manurensis]|uniref:Filamentous hemagglutinin N-terminal domain-containing protein n=1 Tax=Paramixta manurensis TaxID=2740817 RepID=A0A6M8UJ93_9GAMM|nr:filamentous hemagglutinin N-terminal domain-containing protein [Erwiniaceae bacterium PD-1]